MVGCSNTQHVFEGALSQAYWRRSGSAGKRCAMRAFRATGESVEGNAIVLCAPAKAKARVGAIRRRIHSLFTFCFGDAILRSLWTVCARAVETQAPNFHSPPALTSTDLDVGTPASLSMIVYACSSWCCCLLQMLREDRCGLQIAVVINRSCLLSIMRFDCSLKRKDTMNTYLKG